MRGRFHCTPWGQRRSRSLASPDQWKFYVVPANQPDAVVELGTRLRQDFAPECVPILDGRIVRPIDDILASSP